MRNMSEGTAEKKRRPLALVALVATAALVMGLPTLRGGFVGGDDHRLLLNHVLVNHPSVSHAFQLFTIFHRDLYQPLALLSFSLEFAVADALGLFDQGEEVAARLFHLTNVILHAANTVLVWLLVAVLQTPIRAGSASPGKLVTTLAAKADERLQSPVVATLAALLFAVHPLQMEVIAWTNGRMMLLSTLCALASLLSLSSWQDSRRPRDAVLTVVFVLLSSISKVRIGLPVLFIIVVLARRAKLTRRFLALWLTCSVVIGVFVLVNVKATTGAELFALGAEHLRGPRLVRVVLALAWYFQHIVWPAGLASYYPTPPVVAWSDPSTWRATLIALPTLVMLAWACWRWRVARLGVLWFFATLAPTLPLVPARNVLAADRYMYLPLIGLFWVIAALGYASYRRLTSAWAPFARAAVAVLIAVILVPSLIGTGWRVAGFYETPTRKTARIAELFPDTSRVWEKLGWSHYSNGDYDEAIQCAERELRHDSLAVRSGAYQLMGMSELKRGNAERGLELLHEAVSADPGKGQAEYRLALAYDELSRTTEAIRYYEAAVEVAPKHNRTINRLAAAYRRMGRPGDARAMYERALVNNRYEVPAAMGLSELDIEESSDSSLAAAERRLLELLDWMPENTVAWTNLGVARVALGRARDAVEAYTEALRRNPNHVTTAINLAQLYQRAGDRQRARSLFERAVTIGLESVDQATVVHDFFISQGDAGRAVTLWEETLRLYPDSAVAREFLAWSYVLADDVPQAESLCNTMTREPPPSPLVLATMTYIDLLHARYDAATTRMDLLCSTGEEGTDARQRLLGALERFDRKRPNVPWTFCLAAQLLIADGHLQGAELSLRLCEERCSDAPCREQVSRLRSETGGATMP
jgi:tetratricopeptide (TPR) repeat protein